MREYGEDRIEQVWVKEKGIANLHVGDGEGWDVLVRYVDGRALLRDVNVSCCPHGYADGGPRSNDIMSSKVSELDPTKIVCGEGNILKDLNSRD